MLDHTDKEERMGALRAELAAPKRCAIITHYNPDGDAMGSSLGFMHLLRRAGHSVSLVVPNAPPAFLAWMPGAAEAIPFDRARDRAMEAITGSELLFCLDFNRLDRISGAEDAARAHPFKVLIDHHRDPDHFAQITFSDPDSCATAQMIADIVRDLGWSELVDEPAATCLYTGIMTDSGSFRFSSTTPHTMRTAAWLMERGARFTQAHESIMDDNRPERMRLLGFMLNERLEILPEFGTAIIRLSLADLKRFSYQPGDTEGFVNYGLALRGIRMAAYFIERPDMVKLSLRSKGGLPVDELVQQHFSGGGHRNAAGGQSKDSLDATINRFKELLPAFVASHPS
ncbi:MAG: bifunctional oligoribonuclease/PAP phosphatase NrnA [Flavobacteriales bacterium]|nr:bifunctional oligoribonuclease/PAP phosphatase NrnA [Flavobacteriales bacterium]